MRQTNSNRIYLILSIIGLLALVLIPSTFMDQLPDRIPTHFGADGVADGFGSKSSLWTLPVLGGVLFLIISGLTYLIPMLPYDKQKTSPQQYRTHMRLMTHMMGMLNVTMIWLFVYITYRTVQVALDDVQGLGASFMFFSITLLFIPLLYFCRKLFLTEREGA